MKKHIKMLEWGGFTRSWGEIIVELPDTKPSTEVRVYEIRICPQHLYRGERRFNDSIERVFGPVQWVIADRPTANAVFTVPVGHDPVRVIRAAGRRLAREMLADCSALRLDDLYVAGEKSLADYIAHCREHKREPYLDLVPSELPA